MIFGDYTPDIRDRDNAGLTVAKNCVPHAASYKQIGKPVVYSGALNERCQGFIAVKDSSGSSINYAGDDTDLWELTAASTAWNEISKTTGAYSTVSSKSWEFAEWGNQVIAVNGSDTPQVITKGGAAFADLGGTPPTGEHIAIVRDFVVMGRMNSGVPTLDWSAINDETGWTPGTNQSDTQALQSGGAIQKIVGGEYGIVFSETSIRRMTYVGYPLVFQIDEVEPEKGTPASNSVVQFGDMIFYLGRDGFYLFDGSRSTPIGANKVDKTFYSDLDTSYYDRISAVVDPINTLVFWSYPGAGNSSGNPNRILCYNWTTNRWSGPIETEHQLLVQSYTLGVALDGGSGDFASIGYTDLDALPFSLDSRVWQGGEAILSSFDLDNKLNNFTGSAFEAVFETGEYNLNPGGRALVLGARPLFDGDGSATVDIGARSAVNGSVTWKGPTPQNSQTGICPHRADSFYHRARVTISGGFSHAYGIEPIVVATGRK